MNLEATIKMFRDASEIAAELELPQAADVYQSIANMLDTVAQDITIEHGQATGTIKAAWKAAADKLGIPL